MSMLRLMARHLTVTVALATATVFAAPLMAEECFEHVSTRNYTPWDCSATPGIDRVFRMQTITWKGHEYLFLDVGNEITIFNIDSAQNPVVVSGSSFNVPNVGDSDYDMVSFSVCDDCRYGIANFKAATVLFDLGTGLTPIFGSSTQNDQATVVRGGFTFKIDDQQYLVASSLGPYPCPGNNASLYEFNGIDEAGNPRRQCLDGSDGPPKIANGIRIKGTDPPIFYMADTFDRINIYRARTSPSLGLDHLGNGGIVRANMQRGSGIAFDEAAGLAAVASFGNLMVYDIGFTSGTPSGPILLATRDLASLPSANAVALKYPVVYVSSQFSSAPSHTFDISVPSNPVPLDQAFWDPTVPPNNLGSCVWNNHAVFSDDGTAMYLSRYSALQVIDPEACPGSVPSVDFTWVPTSPEIGQWAAFNITGVSANDIEQAVWTFGGTGCGGTTTYTCVEPSFPGCDVAAFQYASDGSKTVGLTVTTTGGVQQPQVQHALTVLNSGSCGGTCTYSISPISRNFPSAGGSDSFSIVTQTGCSWSAFENVDWITITSGSSGIGSGAADYQVAANTGPIRTATIVVAGKTHTVSQAASPTLLFADGFESGDTSAWGVTVP
jgi:hypothetical protein